MVSAGTMARAVASGRSTARFSRAAASSTATTFSSLLIFAATTMGFSSLRGVLAPSACDLARLRSRLKRSVGSRGNHRHSRRRLLVEALLIEVIFLLEVMSVAIPVHNPAPGRAVAVADQLGVEHWLAPRGCTRRRRRARGTQHPAGLCSADFGASSKPQHHAGDAGGAGGKRELAACHRIERL